jgi:tetratricopeptide (TPR) repeat protein
VSRRPWLWLAGLVLTAVAAFSAMWSHAAPRVPTSDDIVLERVPARTQLQQLRPLREQLYRKPDPHTALELARGYLQIGRTLSDPRFVSYAEGTITPWLRTPHPGADLLLLHATALQYLHRFDEAMTALARVFAEEPHNAQAWLIKATILLVQGRFSQAREACRPLILASGHLVAVSCLTGVDSLTGHLASSYIALRSVFNDDPRLPTGLRLSLLNELADMAIRAAVPADAETYLSRAHQLSARDPYTLAAYADFLLLEGRDREVMALLAGSEQQDNLLLRMAIAAAHLHLTAADRLRNRYQACLEAARRDGDLTHLREQARFALEVRGDASEALKLAEQNWNVQHEPADVRIYVAAAHAAHDRDAQNRITAWIRQTHYEDEALQPLAASPATYVHR